MNMTQLQLTPELVTECNKLGDRFNFLVSKGLSKEQAIEMVGSYILKNSAIKDELSAAIALYIGLTVSVKK